MNQPKPEHPDRAKPRVKLVDTDGNVFSTIGLVRRALKDAGEDARASEFVTRAFAARSYDAVLALVFDYVEPE